MWEYKILIIVGILLEIIGVLLLIERSRNLLVDFFHGKVPPQPNRETKRRLEKKQGIFVIVIFLGAVFQIIGLVASP